MRRLLIAILCVLLGSTSALAQTEGPPKSPSVQAEADSPVNYVKLRLSFPGLTRGPSNDFSDVPQTFIKYGTDQFYVYGSGTCTVMKATTSLYGGYPGSGYGPGKSGPNSCLGAQYDGVNSTVGTDLTPIMSAKSITAIAPVQRDDSCGEWLETVIKRGSYWYGLSHNEGPCNYTIGVSNYSMSMWRSPTGAPGTWAPMTVSGVSNGTIAATLNPISTTAGTNVGTGDCSMIPDSVPLYMYMYCGYYDTQNGLTGWHTTIARAPIDTLGPGNWKWLYQGTWSSPALGTPFNSTTQRPNIDLLDWVGTWMTTMPGTPFKAISSAQNHVSIPIGSPPYPRSNIAGNTLLFSTDYIHFKLLPEPILNWDEQTFIGRPTNYDMYLYTTLRNSDDGSSLLGKNGFTYWYVWAPPRNNLDNRYNAYQQVAFSMLTKAQKLQGVPQVGVQLETWYNSTLNHYRTTTVNPYAGYWADGATDPGWTPSKSLGYVMTRCPNSGVSGKNGDIQYLCDAVGSKTSVQIEECWNQGTTQATQDFQLKIDTNGKAGSCPSSWLHVRTVGWMFKSAQAFPTLPVYSCYLTASGYHFSSNNSTCDGQTVVGLLGYVMKD